MDRGKKLGLSIFWVILTILLIIMIVMTVTVNYTFGSSLQSGTIFGKNIFVMNSDIMEPEINNGAAVIADKNEISVLTEGNAYEGTSFGQEDVRQVQDHSSPWQGIRNLREPAPQAASGLDN